MDVCCPVGGRVSFTMCQLCGELSAWKHISPRATKSTLSLQLFFNWQKGWQGCQVLVLVIEKFQTVFLKKAKFFFYDINFYRLKKDNYLINSKKFRGQPLKKAKFVCSEKANLATLVLHWKRDMKKAQIFYVLLAVFFLGSGQKYFQLSRVLISNWYAFATESYSYPSTMHLTDIWHLVQIITYLELNFWENWIQISVLG